MINDSYIVLLLAGGVGSRSGFETPKQYLQLGTSSVIKHSAAVFSRDLRCTAVYVAIRKADRSLCLAALDGMEEKIILLETAAESRQATVSASLIALSKQNVLKAATTLLVHDAARPCLSIDLIDRLIQARKKGHEAVIPALPITETLRRIDHRTGIAAEIERTDVYSVQTPQAFNGLLLYELHQKLAHQSFTDDAGLFAYSDIPVLYIPGQRDNIKITYADDLRIAAAMLAIKTASL